MPLQPETPQSRIWKDRNGARKTLRARRQHQCWRREGERKRLEVLDRLSRHKAGLSPAQKNDFPWWKEAWGEAMVTEHRGEWATRFASWVQNILDSKDSNAFSKFMCDETCRVFHDSKALAIPGG